MIRKLTEVKKKCIFRGMILFEKIILFFLYRGMKVLYKYDTRIRKEISNWPVGSTIVLAACKSGPYLCIRRVSWGIVRVSSIPNPDILITFKAWKGHSWFSPGRSGSPRPILSTVFS